MKALITGASSGIGRDMAQILSEKGYDIIVIARVAANDKSYSEVESSIMHLIKLHNIMKESLEN